jgi:hypothetical protein
MANTQFPQPIWNITDIGSKIHFRDIELCNHNGVLQTSVYHEHMYHNDILPPFLNIIQIPIQKNVWKWLRESLLKAIRYCSTKNSFDDERDEIKIILNLHEYSDEIFDQGHDEILEDFGVSILYPPFIRSNYDIMREHVFNYDKYRKAKKKHRQERQQQEEIILQLPYPSNWDGTIIANFEQQINHILNENFQNHPQMNHFTIKILQNRDSSFPIEHFLIKKRPDVDCLTLFDYNKNKPCTYSYILINYPSIKYSIFYFVVHQI